MIFLPPWGDIPRSRPIRSAVFPQIITANEKDATGCPETVEQDILDERCPLRRQALMELIKDGDRIRERPCKQDRQTGMESCPRHGFDEKCPESEKDGEVRRFPNQELNQADAPFRLERHWSSGVLEVDGRQHRFGPRPIEPFER